MPARQRLVKTIQRALEADVDAVAGHFLGEAHEQIDRAEAGGRYFEDLAESIGADSSVNEVRVAGMCRANDGGPKNSLIQRCSCSSCQIAIGGGPRNYGRSA